MMLRSSRYPFIQIFCSGNTEDEEEEREGRKDTYTEDFVDASMDDTKFSPLGEREVWALPGDVGKLHGSGNVDCLLNTN